MEFHQQTVVKGKSNVTGYLPASGSEALCSTTESVSMPSSAVAYSASKSSQKKNKLFDQNKSTPKRRKVLGLLSPNNCQGLTTTNASSKRNSERSNRIAISKKGTPPGFTIFSPEINFEMDERKFTSPKEPFSAALSRISCRENPILETKTNNNTTDADMNNSQKDELAFKIRPSSGLKVRQGDDPQRNASFRTGEGNELDTTKSSLSISYPQVPRPTPEDLQKLYDQAVSDKTSHQYQLTRQAKMKILSFEDVLLPALAREEKEALKDCELNAIRNASKRYKLMMENLRKHNKQQGSGTFSLGDSFISKDAFIEQDLTVQLYQRCRAVIKMCRSEARKSAKEERLAIEQEREEAIENMLQERLREEAAKLKKEIEARQSLRRKERIAAKEKRRIKRRLEHKKHYSKNKELWREDALLMTALAKLEHQANEWDSILNELDEKERALQLIKDDPIKLKQWQQQKAGNFSIQVEAKTKDEELRDTTKETMIKTIDELQLSAETFNHQLNVTLSDVNENNIARKRLYEKYTVEHQFRGYRGAKQPKALISNMIRSNISTNES